MAISITLTVPDVYVPRITAWIDANYPLSGNQTYQGVIKNIIIQRLTEWVKYYENQKALSAVPQPQDLVIT